MRISSQLRQSTVAALVLAVGFSLPCAAQNTVPDLLEALKESTPEEAMRLDRQLRAEWSKSGSASMDLLLRRGREALEAEDMAAAVDHFRALTDHAPDFAEGWHGLARAYFEAELYGPTLDALGHVLRLNPNEYNALFGLGVLFQQFGDLRRAEDAFLQVLALHPHHENAQTALDRLKRDGIGRSL